MKRLVHGTTQGSSEGGPGRQAGDPKSLPTWTLHVCPVLGRSHLPGQVTVASLVATVIQKPSSHPCQPAVTTVHGPCLPPASVHSEPAGTDKHFPHPFPHHSHANRPDGKGLRAQDVPGPSGHWERDGVQPGFPTSLCPPGAISRKGSLEHQLETVGKNCKDPPSCLILTR